MTRRVVVTGVGCLHAMGIGNEAFFGGVDSMRRPVEPLPQSFRQGYTFKTGHRIPLPEFDMASFGIRTPMGKVMQPEDRMAVQAAKFALEDAGVGMKETRDGWTTDLPEETGVLLGVGFTGLETALDGYLAHNGIRLESRGRPGYHRMTIPMLMTNSPAAWCGILFGIHGRVHTVNAACASGTIAIGEAFEKIRSGTMPAALCGGVENLQESTGAVLRGFDQLGVCTRSADGDPRPFSDGRTGFLFSEGGACVLVLEERGMALARGARVLAEIVEYQENNDAHSIVQLAPDGRKLKELVRKVLGGREIQLLNAHGTGTTENDRIESEVVREIWPGERSRPWVQATKSLLGHTFGAGGAFEAAICARGLHEGRWHGTPCSEPVEGMRVLDRSADLDLRTVLTLSLGFGGHNAALVMEKHVP